MNIELRRRTSPLVGSPRIANDNSERPPVPARPRALIYRPAKSAMTSGRTGTKRWVLEFAPQSAPFIEPLMGWTGSTDPLAQLRLTFPTREAAIAYAERQGLVYELHDRSRAAAQQQERVAVTLEPAMREPAYAAAETSQAA